MTGLDTNILVRYIAQDDPDNSPLANVIMKSLSAEDPGWISVTATAEFAWILNRKFRVSRADVYSLFDQFCLAEKHKRALRLPGMRVLTLRLSEGA